MRTKQSNFQRHLLHDTTFHQSWKQHSLSSHELIACQHQSDFGLYVSPIVTQQVAFHPVSASDFIETTESIWVSSRNCGCLVTWFCYQLIAKPGYKTVTVSWTDPKNLKIRQHKTHCKICPLTWAVDLVILFWVYQFVIFLMSGYLLDSCD